MFWMLRLRGLYEKYREVILYVFFGGVTSLTNMAVYLLLKRQIGLPTGLANACGLTASILVAYVTNRKWVFMSHTKGLQALREFLWFIACRLGTAVLDQAIVVTGVEHMPPLLFGEKGWEIAVKLFAMVLVILLNYVFSKLMIFRKEK